MVYFTFKKDQLAEKDIYTIRHVESLRIFLENEYSLCLVHAPVFQSDFAVEMTRVDGFDSAGRADQVWLGKCGRFDQGFLRCKLDKILSSSFLFATWKKSGYHEIRIIQGRKELTRFNCFEEALQAYLPNGFQPTYSYTREKSLLYLFCLAHKRRKELEKLVTLLTQLQGKGS